MKRPRSLILPFLFVLSDDLSHLCALSVAVCPKVGFRDAAVSPRTFPLASTGFSKILLHLSSFTLNRCLIMDCVLKDVSVIFQPHFIAERGKKFCGEKYFFLRQEIFVSLSNDFPISAERNETWLKHP